jgi:glutaredoxin-like protein
MLDEKISQKAKEILGELPNPVKLVAFTREAECDWCAQNLELARDVAALSDRITLEEHDFVADGEARSRYGIDKVPALVVEAAEDYGIRFYGVPSGYEFVSLLDVIKVLSTGEHGLSEGTVAGLALIDIPVRLQVFVTPTCPYCSRSVVLANRLAFVSAEIRSEMVEAIEFPDLANRYGVMGVPRSVINEDNFIEGALPEDAYVGKILSFLGKS